MMIQNGKIQVMCWPITKLSRAKNLLVYAARDMHALSIITVEIEEEAQRNSNIGNNSYILTDIGVIILLSLDQHPVQMQNMEKNGVIHQDVKMEMPVSIVIPALSNSSIQKFINLPNAMTCKQIATALEVRFVLLLMAILK